MPWVLLKISGTATQLGTSNFQLPLVLLWQLQGCQQHLFFHPHTFSSMPRTVAPLGLHHCWGEKYCSLSRFSVPLNPANSSYITFWEYRLFMCPYLKLWSRYLVYLNFFFSCFDYSSNSKWQVHHIDYVTLSPYNPALRSSLLQQIQTTWLDFHTFHRLDSC